LIVVILDQITKQIFWHSYDIGRSADVIEGIFRLTLVRNAGAAFGVFEGGRIFFIIASVIAIIFLIYIGRRLPAAESYKRFFLALILGGAVGNLIDRVYAGAVIDFLEIGVAGHWWPVFNVADIAVSVGAVLLLIWLVRAKDDRDAREPGPAGGDGPGVSALDGSSGP
jgi:signal peptidase II